MYSHLIWDFDGTLYDTYPAMARAFWLTLRQDGHEADFQEVMRLMRESIAGALAHYTAAYGLSEDFPQRYSALRRTCEQESSPPFAGIPDLLRRVREAGGRHYICSHRGRSMFTMLERDGLSELFDGFATADMHFPRKPDPASVQYLLDTCEIPAGQALMIGDRPLDILAGKNAGLAACFFSLEGKCCPDADFQAHSVQDLAQVIGLPQE